jgi:UDP-N-acetylglucosamine 2-epimerase (non-hydrolysing)
MNGDGGGLQEETATLAIPCITIREHTERLITIDEGSDTFVRTTAAGILAAYKSIKNLGA